MASPITWRNVDAPDLTGVSQIMAQGNYALNKGLESLQQTAEQYRANQISNFDNTTTRNTDALVQQIRNAQGIDQLQQLAPGLDPTTLQQQYGAQIDASKVQDALFKQPDLMRVRQDSTDKFTDNQAMKQFRQQLHANTTAGGVLAEQLPQGMADPGLALAEKQQVFNSLNAQEQLIAGQNKTQRINSLNNVLMQALQTGTSPEALSATAQQAGAQLQLSPEDITAAYTSIRKTSDTLSAVTPEQQQTLTTGTLPFKRSLEEADKLIQQQDATFYNDHSVLKEFKQSDEQAISQADAFAASKGWNATNTWFDGRDGATGPELREKVLGDLRDYEKELGRPVSGWVVKRALETIGDNGEGWGSHDHQISTNEFIKTVKYIDQQLANSQEAEQAYLGTKNLRQSQVIQGRDLLDSSINQLNTLTKAYNTAVNQGNVKRAEELKTKIQKTQRAIASPFTLNTYSPKK